MVVCNSNAEEAETGGPQEIAGKLVLHGVVV